ncbi:uncharacterized protein LOC121239487 [Juglans microcarpa x Juglans regia]|uniref:uncharacterized protein LOC121239487 n=1 Tax=Juglans microcarpa x Juglans regia TaxID=2249226 RepID=UPI001B7E8CEE|nr:uncharacterized protein LOC121239487 [Juglans microcarpa x Juglans regia]
MEFATLVQGTMTVHQYAAKFIELSCFAAYLIPDEEKKARKYKQGLNEKLYERVVGFQIRNFSKLVDKAIVFERSLQRSFALHNQRRKTISSGHHSGMDQGTWKNRNEGRKRDYANHCGKLDYYLRDFPLQLDSNRPPPPRVEGTVQGNIQRTTVPAQVFALTPGEDEDRNNTLSLFSNNATVLFDSEVTHSFISMTYSQLCTLETEKLKSKLVVATPTRNSVVSDKILPGCPLSIEGRLMPADLIVSNMIEFDVILGMDSLACYHPNIDCFKKEVVFRPPKESEFRFTGSKVRLHPPIISVIQVGKLLRDGCQGFLAYVVEAPKEELKLEKIPVVREYLEIFPEDLPRFPLEREVEFTIELVPGTAPLSKVPYRMAPSELVELKEQLQDLLDKSFIRPSVTPWELQLSL